MKYLNIIPSLRHVFVGLLSVLVVLVMVGSASADTPANPCDEDANKDKDICKINYGGEAKTVNVGCVKTSQTSFDWGSDCATTSSLISVILKTLAGLVGIAVICGIVWGGMLYTTSNGNASKAQQGISIIINAVIGLLLFIFMFALINFLVPGGILR